MSALSAPAYDFACLIGGEEVRGEASFAVHYPYTGEEVGHAPLLVRGQVDRALSLAGSCRIRLDRHERAQVLERVAERIAR